jgi:DNA-binding CsgD family transcriptional regulator
VDAGDASSGVRLAELVVALSLATDLGLGQPQEHVLRQTVIARRLAAAAGLPYDQQTAVFYVSLLAWVGCVSDSHELAAWFGDDQRLRADSYEVDKAGMPMLRFVLGQVGQGSGPMRRLMMIGRFLAGGADRAARSLLGHCQATGDIADRLGLGAQVGEALQQAFERWDGKGIPGRRAGEQIDPAMRVVQIADDVEVFHRVLAAAGHRVRRRPALPAGLTPREAEILVLLARGLSNKQIAEKLSVSARTVSSHVEHVYAKIGVSARGAAALFAMRHGLVDSRADRADRNIGQIADARVIPPA